MKWRKWEVCILKRKGGTVQSGKRICRKMRNLRMEGYRSECERNGGMEENVE